MLGLQTIGCIHDIPLVRSSTEKLQNVYAKAKDTSALIRLPCSMVESVADKSIKIAVTLANPIVAPFSRPVRMLDGLAAEKIRQFEAKYPVINTSTKEVVETFNEKTEPVRQVMNSVKDTTASTIQHGKETVSNVATATVHQATNAADAVFSFCETYVPGKSTGPVPRHDFGARTSRLSDRLKEAMWDMLNYFFHSAYLSTVNTVVWFRLLAVYFLIKLKDINDSILKQLQRAQILFYLPHLVLVKSGAMLQWLTLCLRPDDRTLAEFKQTSSSNNKSATSSQSQQQQRYFSQQQQQTARPSSSQQHTVAPGVRQSVVTTYQETNVTCTGPMAQQQPVVDFSHMSDKEQLHARLAYSTVAANGIDTFSSTSSSNRVEPSNRTENPDIARLHQYIKPSDMELLYSRLPVDTLPNLSSETSNEPLTVDQQQLHARLIGAEIDHLQQQNGSDEDAAEYEP